jgi:hypothetical protein
MTNLTLIQSGNFVSTGDNVTLNLRPGTNFMKVWNISAINATTVGVGFVWEWNLGMGGIEYQENGAGTAVNILPRPNDFIPVDTSLQAPGAPIAVTAVSNVVRPIVSTGNTTGLATGSVVRLSNVTALPNLMGYDWSIDTIVNNTSFRLAAGLANIPGAVGGAGFWRLIPYDPIFYPTRRSVINITQAAQPVVTTSVAHGYVAGQSVRFNVSTPFGMTQIDGLIGNIVAVLSIYTFQIDIDTTAFTPFVFPGPAAYPFTPAQVVPVGEETDANSNPNLLDDATTNNAILGMILVAGADSPAGTIGDTIYWQAGRTANF